MQPTGTPADASVLIHLAKADVFGLVVRCIGRLEIPPSVWWEAAEARGDRHEQEVARMRLAERDGFLRRVAIGENGKRTAGSLAERYSLGAGEAEVLAMGKVGSHVVLDENRATRVAEELGLIPIRTIRIPVLGITRGHLSGSAAMDLFRRLVAVASPRHDLVARIEQILRRHSR